MTRGSMLVTAAVDTERMTGILLQEGECHLAMRSGWLSICCVPGPAARYATNATNVASVICIDARPGAKWWRSRRDAFAAASKIRIALTRRRS